MYAEAAALIAPTALTVCCCCRNPMPAAEVAICDGCLDILAEDEVEHAAPAVVVVVGTDDISKREVRFAPSESDDQDEDVPTVTPSQMTPEDVAAIEAEAERERGVAVCGTCVTKTDGVCARKGCGRRCCAACMDDEGLCPMCEEV